jgi:hypothetical protein
LHWRFVAVACCIAGTVTACSGGETAQALSNAGVPAAARAVPHAKPTPFLVQTIFAANNNADDPNRIVAFEPPHGTIVSVGRGHISGYSSPEEMTVDASGNLFVALAGSCSPSDLGCIVEFAPPYTGAPSATVTNGIGELLPGVDHTLAVDSAQNLYVVSQRGPREPSGGYVSEYALPYTAPPIAVAMPKPPLDLSEPDIGIVANQSDVFGFFTVGKFGNYNYAARYVHEYQSPIHWGKHFGQVSAGAGCPPNPYDREYYCIPTDAAFDSHGNLFVAWANSPSDAGRVDVYPPPYRGGPSTIITLGIAMPTSLAVDAKGHVFVLNSQPAHSSVTEYAAPYTSGPVRTIRKGIGTHDHVGQLLIDSAGNVFVSDRPLGGAGTPGTVLEYLPPYTGDPIPMTDANKQLSPFYLALGPS